MRIALSLMALASLGADTSTTLEHDLDGDGRAERIVVDGAGTLTVTGGDGRGWGSVGAAEAPAGIPAIEVIGVGIDRYIHVRWPGAGAGRALETVVFVDHGALRPVYAGATGPRGRDAERAERLRVDGEGVLRYQTAPGVARCDGYDVLFPELYDPRQGRFRGVIIPAPPGAPLAAAAHMPAIAPAEPLGLFRFVAASTVRGDEGRADRLAAPSELDDARSETAWVEGLPGSGRGAFATARSRAPGRKVTGVRLTRPAGGGYNRLNRIVLMVGSERYSVELPPTESAWIALPSPIAADCVSIVLDEAAPPNRGDTAIADAAIYTDLDGRDGPALLARAIADGAPGVDALAEALTAHGTGAIAAIRATLPGAGAEARRRLLQVAVTVGGPEAAALLAGALSTAGEEERALLSIALARPRKTMAQPEPALGELALPSLMSMARDPSQAVRARADAIRLAGGWAHGVELRELVALSATDQPLLREAVVTLGATAHAGELLPIVAGALAAGGPRLGDAARMAMRLAPRLAPEETRSLADAISAAWPNVRGFAPRFHLLRAARSLHSPRLLPIIASARADADEAIRWAAVAAAAAIDGEPGGALLDAAVSDEDPRVRAAAIAALVHRGSPNGLVAARQALERDEWPMVRRLAADLLGGGSCGPEVADALRRSAAGDLERSIEVRTAAFDALLRCDSNRAGRLAVQLLASARERTSPVPPSLQAQSAAAAASLGLREAVPSITRALDALLGRADADSQVALAAALTRALGRFDDPRAEASLLRAAHALTPPVRAAAIEALGALTDDAAATAIASASGDADASVRRAAAVAERVRGARSR